MTTEEQDKDKATEQPATTDANGGGGGQGEGTAKATFTQEQIDAIIATRLERANETITSKILGDLGAETLEDAAKAIKEAGAAKLAQMSELEQAQAKIAEVEAEAVKARAEGEALRATAAEALLRAAVISAASEFQQPDDAWMHIDRSKLKMAEDGKYAGIDEAIKSILEAKPYLGKQAETPNLGNQTRGNKSLTKTWADRQKKTTPDTPRQPITRF